MGMTSCCCPWFSMGSSSCRREWVSMGMPSFHPPQRWASRESRACRGCRLHSRTRDLPTWQGTGTHRTDRTWSRSYEDLQEHYQTIENFARMFAGPWSAQVEMQSMPKVWSVCTFMPRKCFCQNSLMSASVYNIYHAQITRKRHASHYWWIAQTYICYFNNVWWFTCTFTCIKAEWLTTGMSSRGKIIMRGSPANLPIQHSFIIMWLGS